MSEIDDFIARYPADRQVTLQHIRKIVKQTVPEADEAISYGMPAFRYKRKYLLGYNAFSRHYGLFPTPGPIAALKHKLSGYTLAKGTIQFTTDNPMTDELLVEIITKRKESIDQGS